MNTIQTENITAIDDAVIDMLNTLRGLVIESIEQHDYEGDYYHLKTVFALSSGSDVMTVSFIYLDTGEGDHYDIDTEIDNADWAGLDDQLEAMQLAVKAFKQLGFDKQFCGRPITVVGM